LDKPKSSLREAVKTLANEEMHGAEHPSTSSLLAYHRGETSPGEAATIREHLSLCTECAAVVLDATDFFSDDEEDEDYGSADLDGSWEKLRKDLGKGTNSPPSRPPVLPLPLAPPKRPLFRSLGFAYSLAAAFAALSISLIVLRGSTPPPKLQTIPQTNVGLYDLTSATVERGEGAGAKVIQFRSPGDSAFLILNPALESPLPRHGVRIRRADGMVAWRSEDLVPQDSGGFHLSLPAGALPAGIYSIELYGIGKGREIPLGTYPIVIEK